LFLIPSRVLQDENDPRVPKAQRVAELLKEDGKRVDDDSTAG
jgi:hypothetical protein